MWRTTRAPSTSIPPSLPAARIFALLRQRYVVPRQGLVEHSLTYPTPQAPTKAPNAKPTIAALVASDQRFSILTAAIEVTGLEPDLDNCRFGPVTYVGAVSGTQSFGGTWSACVDEDCT